MTKTKGDGFSFFKINISFIFQCNIKNRDKLSPKNWDKPDKGHVFEHLLRADLIVDGCVILELKSLESAIRAEHRMQLLSYLKLANYPLGEVINFGSTDTCRYRRVILSGANLPDADF